MTEKPDADGPLAVKITVEIITYVIYLSWLSVIAAGALYLDIPPLPAVESAVSGPWQGTAAAIAVGALTLAVLRAIYNALRERIPRKAEPEPPPQPEEEPVIVPAKAPQKRTKKKKKKKSRRSRKR